MVIFQIISKEIWDYHQLTYSNNKKQRNYLVTLTRAVKLIQQTKYFCTYNGNIRCFIQFGKVFYDQE